MGSSEGREHEDRESSGRLGSLLWGGKLQPQKRQTPISNPISGYMTLRKGLICKVPFLVFKVEVLFFMQGP